MPDETIGPEENITPDNSKVPAAQPGGANLNDDIARILQEVKLPERREQQGTPGKQPAPAPRTYDTALGATARAIDESAPAATTPTPTPPEPTPEPSTPAPEATQEQAEEAPSPVVALHTMKTDLQDIVREEKISLVHVASMEQERHREEAPAVIVPPKRRGGIALLLVATLVFLLLGASALFGLYIVTHSAQSGTPQPMEILFAENHVDLPIDGTTPAALKQAIVSLMGTQTGAAGSIVQIIPTTAATDTPNTQEAATLTQFMGALGANPPSDLMGALSDNFFFGVYSDLGTGEPVFVIPVTAYDRAFAGMLAWESTIDSDLTPIFASVPAITAGPGGLPVDRTFVDDVMRNYDVRELKDDSGNIVLYYSFPTPDILIIAATPDTFPEVLSRLQAEGDL